MCIPAYELETAGLEALEKRAFLNLVGRRLHEMTEYRHRIIAELQEDFEEEFNEVWDTRALERAKKVLDQNT